MTVDIRTTAGVIINEGNDLFSQIVNIGDNVYSARFRLYNNFSGAADQPDIKNIKMYFAGTANLLTPYEGGGHGLEEWDKSFPAVTLLQSRFSGVCKVSAKAGGVDPMLAVQVLSHDTPIDDEECDLILGSGSNNYNEYEVYLNVPSGTVLDGTSGTIHAVFHYEKVPVV